MTGWLLLAALAVGAQGRPYWRLAEPNSFFCEIDGDDCVQTTEIMGDDYFGGGSCRIIVEEEDWSPCRTIDVKYFDIDGQDSLTVNGVEYRGGQNYDSEGEVQVTPSGDILWTSSAPNPSGRGFRLCPGSDADDCSADGAGVPILAVVAGVFVLFCICIGGLCIFMCIHSGLCKGYGPASEQPKAVHATVVAPQPPLRPIPEVVSATVVGVAAGSRPPMEDNPNLEDNPDMEAPAPAPTKKYFVEQRKRGPVPAKAAAPPPYWRGENSGLVAATEAETLALQNMARNTFKSVSTRDRQGKPMPKGLKVVKVSRNENAQLWAKYTAGRFGVEKSHSHKCVKLDDVYGGRVLTFEDLPPEIKEQTQAGVNECFLWHGTSPEGAAAICKTGFDLTRAGSHVGSMYGPGAYLAECSSKSDEYASSGEGIYDGMFCFLLCRVVLGEVHMLTNAGEQVHGIVKASMESGAYDSVLGNREAAVGTYREFVVYQEDQIYPEFVVIYEREM